ncbi:hypothetical protein HOK51_05660 [Candidatus Woesearchaeota archaeon]|jgi:hypothetical protein|nr:hypothetical protein [Candidatus Woesearchaeota archaeon]MBT6519315.1 hypothetical protein [Candidatus Woesearchaeota archaeon]MBT7368968.1 hypothetical protein [Candidatus Woesearchaeota archaeon]
MNFKILKHKPSIIDEIEDDLLKNNISTEKAPKTNQKKILESIMFRQS